MSPKYRLNLYDFYSGVRDVLLLIVSFCVANIDVVKTLLERYNVNATVTTFIVWFILEMGRRFIRNYKK